MADYQSHFSNSDSAHQFKISPSPNSNTRFIISAVICLSEEVFVDKKVKIQNYESVNNLNICCFLRCV